MKQSDQGILIHRQNYSESSLLLLFSPKKWPSKIHIQRLKEIGNLNPLES